MLTQLIIRLITRYQKNGGGKQYNVTCNFTPSCSEYSKQALIRFGLLKGLKLTFKRLKRCNHPDLLHKINDPLPEHTHDIFKN